MAFGKGWLMDGLELEEAELGVIWRHDLLVYCDRASETRGQHPTQGRNENPITYPYFKYLGRIRVDML